MMERQKFLADSTAQAKTLAEERKKAVADSLQQASAIEKQEKIQPQRLMPKLNVSPMKRTANQFRILLNG